MTHIHIHLHGKAKDAQNKWGSLAAWKEAVKKKYPDAEFSKRDYMVYAHTPKKSSPVGDYDVNMDDAHIY